MEKHRDDKEVWELTEHDIADICNDHERRYKEEPLYRAQSDWWDRQIKLFLEGKPNFADALNGKCDPSLVSHEPPKISPAWNDLTKAEDTE